MSTQRPSPILVLLIVLGLVLAACGGQDGGTDAPAAPPAEDDVPAASPGDEATEASPGDEAAQASPEAPAWTGTITMYAQHYTPNARDAEEPLTAFREVADEYEQMHPGITIEFIDEEFQNYEDVIRVTAASGELWDVFWAQWAQLNGPLPQGIAVDLKPYFEEPNPYISDAPTWKEAMNETIVNETASPSGAHYNINGDYVATAFFYNQGLFEQARITDPPQA